MPHRECGSSVEVGRSSGASDVLESKTHHILLETDRVPLSDDGQVRIDSPVAPCVIEYST